MLDVSPVTTLGRRRLRDALALPLIRDGEVRNIGPLPKDPQELIDRAEACERLAETAISLATGETMLYLALRWRMLAAEAKAELQAPGTRKPTRERPSSE